MSDQVTCSICGRTFSQHGIGSHIWRMHGEGQSFDANRGFKDGTRCAWNKGLSKETDDRLKRISDNRKVKKSALELELDDDGKLRQKYFAKKGNAKLAGVECELSLEEFCQLVKDAGIVSSQLGFSGQGYVLARYNDEGSYAVGNCRFITQADNVKERKVTDKVRLNAQRALQFSEKDRNRNPQKRSDSIKRGLSRSSKMQARHEAAVQKQAELRKTLDKRYTDEHNSQFGTMWITDGCFNAKWRTDRGDLPEGFRRGRVMGLPFKDMLHSS